MSFLTLIKTDYTLSVIEVEKGIIEKYYIFEAYYYM